MLPKLASTIWKIEESALRSILHAIEQGTIGSTIDKDGIWIDADQVRAMVEHIKAGGDHAFKEEF